ncbi:MAG: TorF family putative porin [Gammaproteobacteria bacterium]|jgi:uncharacterized protein (TIGR02001 family)
MKLLKNVTPLAAASAIAISTLLAPAVTYAEMSGNIGVVSNYILRGITNPNSYAMENDGAAVQGGLDWNHSSGFYLGYWGSSLSYTSDPEIPTFDGDGNPSGVEDGCKKSGDCPSVGYENDIYLGYAGSAGGFEYSAGLIQYYYIGVEKANGLEIALSGSMMGATLGLNYLANDVAWGNSGDMYWTLGYDFGLPKDFTLGASLGYYIYEKSGKYIPKTIEDPDDSTKTLDAKSSAFRHLNLSLSHPIGTTGADMSITAIIGGQDRFGQDQPATFTLGMSYGFDI